MNENLAAYFKVFGTLVNGVRAIFEEADEDLGIGFDSVQATGPKLYTITGSLIVNVGDQLTIDGRVFKVRKEPRKLDDGKISQIDLIEIT
jgi:hypothetical protein